MANGFTVTTANDLIVDAVAAAQFVVNDGWDLTNCVTVRNLENAKSIRFPVYSNVALSAHTEGEEISTTTDPTLTYETVTASTSSILIPVSDQVEIAYKQAMTDAGTLIGKAIKDTLNQAIFDTFDQFTNYYGSDGSSAAPTISLSMLRAAKSSLKIAGAPGPYYVALTPYVYADLMSLLNSTVSGDAINNLILTSGSVPKVYGMEVYEIDNLLPAVSEADTAYCGVFSASGIGFANGWAKIESQRNAKRIATDLIGSVYFGTKVINPAWGIGLNVSNIPTDVD